MPILTIFLTLIIVGALVYFINAYVPMAAPFKFAVNLIAVVLLLVFLYNVLRPYLHL